MRFSLLAPIAAVAVLSSSVTAEGRTPGTCLIYPVHRSAPGWFSILNITNTNLTPTTPGSFGGATNVMFNYVNTIPNPANSKVPLDCFVTDRVEYLTPGDTLSVLTSWHNAANQEGYVVAVAQDPGKFKTGWPFDYLTGSELVVNAAGGMYSINAIPLSGNASWQEGGEPGNFGVEYGLLQSMGSEVILDCFLAAADSQLAIFSPEVIIPSGADFGTFPNVILKIDIFNDNEFQLSTTSTFRCWFEESLRDVSLVFDGAFLANNTPHDPATLDIDGDYVGDLETGWALIRSDVAFTQNQQSSKPAIHGAITDGPTSFIDGGRLLWEPRGYWGPTVTADVSATVTADSTSPAEGQVVELIMRATNSASSNLATDVLLECTLPVGLTLFDFAQVHFVEVSPPCAGVISYDAASRRIEMELTCINPGTSVAAKVPVKADAGTTGETLEVVASVSAPQFDPLPGNNTDSVSLLVIGNP